MKKILFAAFMLVSFVTLSQTTIKIDSDKDFDFSTFRNFAFISGKIITTGKEVTGDNSMLERKIQDALIKELSDKGFKEVTQPGVDTNFVVTYTAGARTKQELEGMGSGWYGGYGYRYGTYPGWAGPTYNNWWVNEYKEGTIIIDVYDVKTKQLVWKAYCVAELSEGSNDRLLKRIAYKAFKKFPPKKKK